MDRPTLSQDLQVVATHRLVEALVASEQRMRLRIDVLSEIVFELDARGDLVFLSRAWTPLAGVQADQVLAQPLANFVHADDRARFQQLLADAPTEPTFQRPVIRLMRADGATLSMELSVVATRDGGRIGALHDVTEQQRVQQAYERLSLVANHTDNYVVITDAQGRTEWVNDAFCRGTGYRLEEIIGRKPGDVLQGVGTDRDETARIASALRDGRSFSSELINYAKDGRPYWITIYVTPIVGAAGAVERYISVQTDTTEMRRVLDQLDDARRKAEDASNAKSSFLSAMSHEIRTPMNGVLGLASLLLDSELDPTQHQYASMIVGSGQSLLAIIDDILDFSKIEAGKLSIEDIEFDLDVLLEDLAGLHLHRARAKSLALQVAVERREGTLTWIRFEVTDTGIGIPAATQPLLFQPFSQADSSNSRRFGGTGLGLAISRQLVELMQGRIDLVSTEGVGSTFSVVLPLTAVDGIRPVVSVDTDAAGANRRADARLLVAEDNRTNQVVARGLLRKLGYHDVVMVDDGAQAIEALRSGPFDLVLMDCQMPVLDGYRATTRLRELGFRLPVIALTANAMRGDRDASLAAGMDDHLAKPVQLRDLAAVLDRWLPARTPAVDGPAAADASAPPAPMAFDRAALLDRLDGDETLLGEILQVAVADLPEAIRRVQAAATASDHDLLRTHAHGLKGAAANIGALALADAARSIEFEAKDGRIAALSPLTDEFERFRAALGTTQS